MTRKNRVIDDQNASVDAPSKQSLRLWIRLISTTNLLEQQIRSRLRKKFNITLPQFDVLAMLERTRKKLTMTELSRELMVSNGNITGVVDRLVREELVERLESTTDRRIQYITLTRKGRKTFDRIAKAHEEWVSELLSGLVQEETIHLSEQLRHVKTRINEKLTRDLAS